MNRDIRALIDRLRLSPYQMHILIQHGYKYDLGKIKMVGPLVYAPHRCDIPCGLFDNIRKLFFGPKADLIGTDKMLAFEKRRYHIEKSIHREHLLARADDIHPLH